MRLLAGAVACALATSLCACAGPSEPDRDPQEPVEPSVSATPRSNDAAIIAEHNDRMLACFRDLGAEVTPEPGGGWGVDGGESSLVDLIPICRERIGDPPLAPPTAEEAAALYELYLETAECLRERGLSVTDPPSEKSWVQAFLAGDLPWLPYDGVEPSDGDLDACPEPQLSDVG